jgi:hypothetical protein
MNRLDTDLRIPPVADTAIYDNSSLSRPRRLVVVMLDAEEGAFLAGRILELARSRALPVLLVGAAPDATGAAELRRKLVTLAAFIKAEDSLAGRHPAGSDARMRVELQIEQGTDWIARVKSLVQPDDMLACYSEGTVGMRRRPLTDVLSANLNMPVYAFSGLGGQESSRQSRLVQAVSWLASLGSIGAFLLLQARIVMVAQGWPQSVLLLLTLFAEAGVIYVLNSLLVLS